MGRKAQARREEKLRAGIRRHARGAELEWGRKHRGEMIAAAMRRFPKMPLHEAQALVARMLGPQPGKTTLGARLKNLLLSLVTLAGAGRRD